MDSCGGDHGSVGGSPSGCLNGAPYNLGIYDGFPALKPIAFAFTGGTSHLLLNRKALLADESHCCTSPGAQFDYFFEVRRSRKHLGKRRLVSKGVFSGITVVGQLPRQPKLFTFLRAIQTTDYSSY